MEDYKREIIRHKAEEHTELLFKKIDELKKECELRNVKEIFITEMYKEDTKQTVLVSYQNSPVTNTDEMYKLLGFSTKVTRMFLNPLNEWKFELLYYVGTKSDVLSICSYDKDFYAQILKNLEAEGKNEEARFFLDCRVHGHRLLTITQEK